METNQKQPDSAETAETQTNTDSGIAEALKAVITGAGALDAYDDPPSKGKVVSSLKRLRAVVGIKKAHIFAELAGWFSVVGDLKQRKVSSASLLYDGSFFVLSIKEAISWVKVFEENSEGINIDGDVDDDVRATITSWWHGYFPIMATPFGDFVMVCLKSGKVVTCMLDTRHEKTTVANSISSFIQKMA